jgi:hypothetical protein
VGNIRRCYLGVNTRRKIQTGGKYKEKEEKRKKNEEVERKWKNRKESGKTGKKG